MATVAIKTNDGTVIKEITVSSTVRSAGASVLAIGRIIQWVLEALETALDQEENKKT